MPVQVQPKSGSVYTIYIFQNILLVSSSRNDFNVLFFFRGKYATVCKAVHKSTSKPYAAKFVKKRRRNQDQTKEIIHEIAVLIQCENASRVIRLHEVYESPTDMVLVLELAAGGELQHILDGGQCLGEVSYNNRFFKDQS